ncbi:MAG: hypothetical protein ACTHK8_21375 [Ginsengibacter sp.]
MTRLTHYDEYNMRLIENNFEKTVCLIIKSNFIYSIINEKTASNNLA